MRRWFFAITSTCIRRRLLLVVVAVVLVLVFVLLTVFWWWWWMHVQTALGFALSSKATRNGLVLLSQPLGLLFVGDVSFATSLGVKGTATGQKGHAWFLALR